MVESAKLCPLCGGLPKFDYVKNYPTPLTFVTHCEIRTSLHEDKEEALKEWNRIVSKDCRVKFVKDFFRRAGFEV